MQFRMWLTDDAARDLGELFDYIAINRGPAEAGYVLGRIEQAFFGPSDSPERGTYPKELLALGIRGDLRALLERRLLEA